MTTQMRIQLLQTAINALKQMEADKVKYIDNPAHLKLRIDVLAGQYADCIAQLASEGMSMALLGSLTKNECEVLTYMELEAKNDVPFPEVLSN